MHETTRELVEGGAAAVHAMVAERREETLFLEFKALWNAFNPEGRKRALKAICGLSNAEGGTLVIGVQTARVDNVDVADRSIPLQDAGSFANRLKAAVAEGLSPQHPGIEVHAILVDGGPTGFVIVDVPASDHRPHMSLATDEYRYYRRGLIGTAPMTHSEVRDLMLASRNAALIMSIRVEMHTAEGTSFGGALVFEIENISNTPAFSPYCVIKPPVIANTPLGWAGNSQSNGGYLIASKRDVIIHPGTKIRIGSAEIWAAISILYNILTPADLDRIQESGDISLVTIGKSREDIAGISDRLPNYECIFGAENCPASKFSFLPSKKEIINNIFSEIKLLGYR